MSKKLNNNELKTIGFKDQSLVETAGKIAKRLISRKVYTKEALLELYKKILTDPELYLTHDTFGELAQEIASLKVDAATEDLKSKTFDLRKEPVSYPVFGKEHIDKEALVQMNTAMKLPVALAGALMPDAHSGYGLPIGGVLATAANVVIPYAVGVDIACRMCLSVYEISANFAEQKKHILKKHLGDHTYFGLDSHNEAQLPDTVFDLPDWKATAQIRHLRHKAQRQLGTSGTGNHFVEFGTLDIPETCPELPLPKGQYLALLSHSGSRGFGAGIANYYSKIALDYTKLPREAQHLAWLDLNTEAGQEYWIGMNLAGEYASACHHQVHRRLAQALELKPVATIENHHNFAWQETLADGTPAIDTPQGSHACRKRGTGHHSGVNDTAGLCGTGQRRRAGTQFGIARGRQSHVKVKGNEQHYQN